MSLKLVSLASGSKGNATLIFSDKTAVLVDAGISYTHINSELKDFGLSVSSLDGVLVTHEHSDHICALERVSAECRVYAHQTTQAAIARRIKNLRNMQQIDNFEGGFYIGDIKVLPFRIPHDAAYPLAYSFECEGARVSVATDIGVPTVGVMKNIKDSSVVLLESNYDANMLKTCRYPFVLKQRIMSPNGHLSNDSASRIAQLLAQDSNVKQLVLGHISQNSNTEQLAYDCVWQGLRQQDADIELFVAHQDRRSEVFEVI